MALKPDLIRKIVHHVRKTVRGRKAAAAERFVRAYYSHVAMDDIRASEPEDLCAAALSLFDLAATRRPGVVKIRAFNPRRQKPARQKNTWGCPHTVVEIVNDDMPFLVDSLTMEFNRRNIGVHLNVHPVVHAMRDKAGRLTDVTTNGKPKAQALSESCIHLEIDEQPAAALKEIQESLKAILQDVRFAVTDWHPMLSRVNDILFDLESSPPPLSCEEVDEGRAFLEWMRDDHFSFLGIRSYDLVKKNGKQYLKPSRQPGLGVLRKVLPDAARRHKTPLSSARCRFVRRKELLIVTKAYSRSTVHRPVHMDYVGVRRFNAHGEVVGEHRFLGLFTSIAYNQSPRYIPLLRRKIARVMTRSGFSPHGHDGKSVLNILKTFPRDELFQTSEEDLLETSLGVLKLEERRRVALFVRRDFLEQFVSCLVYIPHDRYSSDLINRFQGILEDALGGVLNGFSTQVGDAPLARVHFTFKLTPGAGKKMRDRDIEALLVAAARSWRDELSTAFVQSKGEGLGLGLMKQYGEAFSAAYREAFSPPDAVADVDDVDAVLETGGRRFNLYRPDKSERQEACFKIIHSGATLAPSDSLPMLENMGLRVVRDIPYAVDVNDSQAGDSQLGDSQSPAQRVWVHDFVMVSDDGEEIHIEKSKQNFETAFARVCSGEMENDGFNRLILCAGLTWREVVILRAYCKFLRQANIPFSETYMQEALVKNAAFARRLVALFHHCFDPAGDDRAADKMVAEIKRGLDEVENLDEDRIIRRFLNLILSTLRTNYYQAVIPETGGKAEPKPYLSLKLDSRVIDGLPLPRPLYEIFVYSPRVEGVHLRGGKVARGGLRWSDRREDFRTEILGLMKAQMVKNTVIVPIGSKGGFVVKRPPSPLLGREAFLAEGIDCYKTFIGGVLDITDNLKGNRVIPPPAVRCHDDNDPYLVVAADKGTATFSDIANGVSLDHGFWLGDAFASGGSVGYDHKKMGITARGAWESVKRHFRELGLNTQTQDFTVVGVGDMSGDVFGNGMLLSRHIRLVGAFNHLHIFIDPDPDPAKSFTERKRLFALKRSSWSDYNAALISKGGGIFERRAKSITLTPEIKKAFAISRDRLTPAELIQAMMRASVDLLWFGGIGTYIRASDENDAEVGDRANEALRVTADEVQARVLGEGANLGVTQLARIEYALKGGPSGEGGRVNTDAIDNSAGVGCSDHEVNIKIALGSEVSSGRLSPQARNKLLASMTGEVAVLVLRENYRQTQAITVAESHGAGLLDRYIRLMHNLEHSGRLDRNIEFLPDDETLSERGSNGQGLTRPEIAVLLAYAKLWLYDAILESDLPDDTLLTQDLLVYFPQAMQTRHRKAVLGHRLKREIIATRVTNSLINRCGIGFINEMTEKTGLAPADVARAYTITRDVFGLREFWSDIDALDNKIPASVQTEMLNSIGHLIEYSTLWFLNHVSQPLDISHTCGQYAPAIAALSDCLEDLVSTADRTAFKERLSVLTGKGAPRPLAHRVASLYALFGGLDVVRVAARANLPVALVGRVYYALGTRFQIDWLCVQATALSPENTWDREAVSAIVEDLSDVQGALTEDVLRHGGKSVRKASDKQVAAWIERWIETRRHAVGRHEQTIDELRAAAGIDLSMLAVASRNVSGLLGG